MKDRSFGTLLVTICVFASQVGSAATPDAAMIDPTEGNSFNAYVLDQFTYDTNLYRLPSYYLNLSKLVGPSASRQDHLNTTSTGVDGVWTFDTHVIALDLRADYNTFSHNTDLDNTSGLGKVVWDWHAGPLLTGEAGASFTRSLASFANTIIFFAKDVIDVEQYFGSLQLRTGRHWNLLAGINETNTAHGAPVERYDDLRNQSGNFGIQYATLTDNTLSLIYQYTHGTFPREPTDDTSASDRDYRNMSGNLKVKYTLTSKIEIDASAGYLSHKNVDHLGSFSGNVWDGTLEWQLASKTSITLAAWQRLTAYVEAESDYFVARGYSFSPAWQPTERLKLATIILWDRRSFLSSNPTPISLVERRDKFDSQQLSLTYTPRKALSLNLIYRFEKRESNVAAFQYDDQLATAWLTINF